MLSIHRYWTGDKAPTLSRHWSRHVIRSLNPGVDLCEWHDDSLPPSIHDHAHASADLVRQQDLLTHLANVVRLRLLYDFGGWWYDYDVIPLLPVNSLSLPCLGSHKGYCNSFMGFHPGDPFIKRALDDIDRQPPSARPAYIVSGSGLLRRIIPEGKVHAYEYPFDPTGFLLHGRRPFAVHLSLTNGIA